MKPFRFSGSAATSTYSARSIIEHARKAQGSGYRSLVFHDHLHAPSAPLPLLAAVATAAEQIRIGTYVLNVDLRHPAVLAQELASLDVISGGRLDIGLGGGWHLAEYERIGLSFDSISERTGRLREAIEVMRGCFRDAPLTFAGKHFNIVSHESNPKPIQKPSPPLLIAGGGRRMLSLAAQEADIVGLGPRLPPNTSRPGMDPHSITAEATEEKLGWIRSAAGDRFNHLILDIYPSGGWVCVTNHVKAEVLRRIEAMAERTGISLSVEEVMESPHTFIGSIEGIARKFTEVRDRFGISSFMVGDAVEELAPVVESLAGR
ncbi:TIGR03621 family F420-dependent LLM class oxidoreductase (plasmid) [Streptomyces sp. NBC_00015]|uniref:TIGR03621 family F420-dependent LLM class oxidoreductase n=1 Tax=Streptomyces sp. NBC_00015 TaxID=2903611 RepID=UPI002F90F18C